MSGVTLRARGLKGLYIHCIILKHGTSLLEVNYLFQKNFVIVETIQETYSVFSSMNCQKQRNNGNLLPTLSPISVLFTFTNMQTSQMFNPHATLQYIQLLV